MKQILPPTGEENSKLLKLGDLVVELLGKRRDLLVGVGWAFGKTIKLAVDKCDDVWVAGVALDVVEQGFDVVDAALAHIDPFQAHDRAGHGTFFGRGIAHFVHGTMPATAHRRVMVCFGAG